MNEQLREIKTWLQQRSALKKLAATRSNTSHRLIVLFQGAAGSGKRTVAELIGKEFNLELSRVDLSQTISKYIGETEKNLTGIFEAAERDGAILFFDEADALFGKRTDVKDSHDRYANQEISYLLQRIESFGGLVILTTNQQPDPDDPFMRRLRTVVRFPLVPRL